MIPQEKGLDVALLVTGWRQGATLYNSEPTRVGHVALQVDHVTPSWYTAGDDGWRIVSLGE